MVLVLLFWLLLELVVPMFVLQTLKHQKPLVIGRKSRLGEVFFFSGASVPGLGNPSLNSSTILPWPGVLRGQQYFCAGRYILAWIQAGDAGKTPEGGRETAQAAGV